MSKSVFIIGAGPGIGSAVAKRFGREGWSVVVGGRNAARLQQMAETLRNEGIAAHAVTVDASDPDSVRSAVRAADALVGGLSTVVYNAAVLRQQDLFSMTDADIAGDLTVNVAGALHTVRASADIFDGRDGTILLTGGGFAVHPHPDWLSLSIGKAAVRGLVQALAPVLRARRIHLGLATIGTLVSPNSTEAAGAADTLWKLAVGTDETWEIAYPAT